MGHRDGKCYTHVWLEKYLFVFGVVFVFVFDFVFVFFVVLVFVFESIKFGTAGKWFTHMSHVITWKPFQSQCSPERNLQWSDFPK